MRLQDETQTGLRSWWNYMADLMEVNPDNSPERRELKEVFHLE